jgi:HD superfamily phosphodiesterase
LVTLTAALLQDLGRDDEHRVEAAQGAKAAKEHAALIETILSSDNDIFVMHPITGDSREDEILNCRMRRSS